jgi:hypothetical protein
VTGGDTGGGGADRFVFDTGPAATLDRITDFTPGIDRMVLDRADFAGIGRPGGLAAARFFAGSLAQEDAATRIIYNPASRRRNSFCRSLAVPEQNPLRETVMRLPSLIKAALDRQRRIARC